MAVTHSPPMSIRLSSRASSSAYGLMEATMIASQSRTRSIFLEPTPGPRDAGGLSGGQGAGMDLTWSEREEAFRAQARGWLEANVPRDLPPGVTRAGPA